MEKVPTRYAGFHLGLFARASVYASEWVRSLHQKLIYDHCQCEVLVVYVSIYLGEALALQLRRCVFGLSDTTSVYRRWDRTAVCHLERVGVYQGNMFVLGDVGVGFVDVAHEIGVVNAVQPVQGDGEAFGDRAQVRVIDIGGVLAPQEGDVVSI